jgi:hypothetical protein
LSRLLAPARRVSRAFRLLPALAVVACHAPPHGPRASESLVVVPEAARAPSSGEAGITPAPKPAWPSAVDTTLTAPDGFHLIAARPDGKALVDVTGMIQFRDPNTHQSNVRGTNLYRAQFDLATGCMEATFELRALRRASSLGPVSATLAVLGSSEMSEDLARARSVSTEFGPNGSPIAVTPGGQAVLVANNNVYWAKDGQTFARLGSRPALHPTVSADAKYLLFALGAPEYRATVLELSTGRQRPVSGGGSEGLAVKQAYPMEDGRFLAVLDDSIFPRRATRVCALKVDPERAEATRGVCVPSEVLSSSCSMLSADGHYLAIHAEHSSGDRVLVFDTTTWQRTLDVPGRPIYFDVDSRGRVAWDLGPPSYGIVLAADDTLKAVTTPAPSNGVPTTFVGFAGPRLIVGYPAMTPFGGDGPLETLESVGPCGFLRGIDVP